MASFDKPVTIVELSDSGLIRERWVFSLQGPWLLLDRYYYERRWSTAQEFRTVKFYDRGRQPDEEYGDWQWLEEGDVPWDEELQTRALSELLGRIQVVRLGDLDSGPTSIR